VNIAVTIDACVPVDYAVVREEVSRWFTVALETDAVARLIEKTIVGRSVRLVTFRAASSLNKMRIYDRMLVNVRAGVIAMATLTPPVKTDSHQGILRVTRLVTVDATYVSRLERVGRTSFEFRRNRSMTDNAVVVLVILDKILVRVRMNSVALRAAYLKSAVGIELHHIYLMGRDVAATAEVNLPIEFQLGGSFDIVRRRVVDMLLPPVMATDTPN